MLKLIGKAFVALGTFAFVMGACLFMFGAYVVSLPLTRGSRFHARRQASAQVAVSLFALAQTFQRDSETDDTPESR